MSPLRHSNKCSICPMGDFTSTTSAERAAFAGNVCVVRYRSQPAPDRSRNAADLSIWARSESSAPERVSAEWVLLGCKGLLRVEERSLDDGR